MRIRRFRPKPRPSTHTSQSSPVFRYFRSKFRPLTNQRRALQPLPPELRSRARTDQSVLALRVTWFLSPVHNFRWRLQGPAGTLRYPQILPR